MSDINLNNNYPKGFAVFNLFDGSKFAVRVDDIESILEVNSGRVNVRTKEPSIFGVNMTFNEVMNEIGRAQR